MAGAVKGLVSLPLRALRLTFRIVSRLQRGPTPAYLLPVAGLDQERSHVVLFALREAAHEAQADEAEIVGEWLAAVQLAQVGADRLIGQLKLIEADLAFWRVRLEAGSRHGLFLLLGQGPSKFARDVLAVVRHHERRLSRRDRHLTATEKIEQRVTILRNLQLRVAESLAKVNAGAGQLHLRQGLKGSSAQLNDAPAAGLIAVARRSITASLAATAEAFQRLEPLVSRLQHSPDELARPSAAIAAAEGATSDVPELEGGSSSGGTGRNGGGGDGGSGNGRDTAADGAGDATAEPAEPDTTRVESAIRRAATFVGTQPLRDPELTVTDAIAAANRAAHKLGPAFEVPRWLAAPSRYQQFWIRYLAAAAVGAYAAIFVYRHSRLSGSRDFERWAETALRGLRSTYRENVLGPLAQLRDELFKTFRQRRSIVSVEEYENDRESLRRMLADFEADHAPKHSKARSIAAAQEDNASVADAAAAKEAAASDEIMPGMAFMMEAYEQELKRPIRNVINGQLPRTLLIQVQKLKLDTESAMLEMDQLLKANELNLALIAAVPAFLATGGALFLVVRWLKPAPPDPKYEALSCRMAMVALERAVQVADDGGTAHQGLLIYSVSKVYREAWKLYSRHEGSAIAAEWPNLRQDLTELVGPLPLKQKMRTAKRMRSVYTIFQL